MNEKGIQFAYNKEHINILYKLKKKKKNVTIDFRKMENKNKT